MNDREHRDLASALRSLSPKDDAMDDFAKKVIAIKRTLKRAQPIQRDSSKGLSVSLKPTQRVSWQTNDNRHFVNLNVNPSSISEAEEFMEKARRCFNVVDIQPQEPTLLPE